MKKIQQNVFTIILIVTLAVLGASCGDDEEEKPMNVNCASLADKLEAKYAELDEIGYNCEKMRKIFDDIIDILNEGKDCEELKSIAADEGYGSVEEYIAYLEQSFKAYMSDCPG